MPRNPFPQLTAPGVTLTASDVNSATGASRSAPRSRQPAQMSQSDILRQLGVKDPTSQSFKNQISGSGRLQQYFNTRAALKGLPPPFDPSVASAILQDILPLAVIGGAAAGGPASAASGAATGAAADVSAGGAVKGAALFGLAATSITSTLDFLKFIAWLFHPRNILRAVEFLVGLALMFFGMQAAWQARGERVEGFSTSEGVLTRSGLGRVATALGSQQSVRSAPHRTRQRALTQRYRREEDLQRRRAKAPRPKRP